MKMYNGRERGITLVETITAISIGALIALVVISVTISGIKNIRTTKQYEVLHTNMSYVTDTVSRLMRESIAYSVEENGELLRLQFTDGERVITRSDDGAMLVDGTPVTTTGVTIESLSFTSFARSVRLEADLRITDEPYQESITTTIASRSTL